MKTLKYSLTLNAIFSFISGMSLTFGSHWFASIFGVKEQLPFMIIGLGLILFSIMVGLEARRLRPFQSLFIIAQDLLWVIGSIIILAWDPFSFSMMGKMLVLGVAIAVLDFAIFQSIGLLKTDRVDPAKPTKRISSVHSLDLPTEEVWEMVSSPQYYAAIAPNIDRIEVMEGAGPGMKRRCFAGKDQWTEECLAWEKGRFLRFKVNTQAADYPYPFKSLEGNWEVEALTGSSSMLRMWFDIEYHSRWADLVIHPIMKKKFGPVLEKLVSNLKKSRNREKV